LDRWEFGKFIENARCLMPISTSYFSTHTCLGGACIGAKAAGLTPLGGIEIDPYPVSLYRKNFGNGIRHESVLDTPIPALPDFDFLWSSPSCKSFSTSKTDGKELSLDVSIAKKIAEIIHIKSPRYFALENVRGYLYKPKSGESVGSKRNFTDSFKLIYNQLEKMGYNLHFGIYDAADFGVPQNRNRLILRASRDPLRLLQPTRCKTGNLFWPRWNGWYKAIADLLPSCKPSHLTERQIEALENKGWYEDILKGLAVSSEYMMSNGAIGRVDKLPIGTITTQSKPAAVLVEGKDSITANQGGGGRSLKALILDCKGNRHYSDFTAIEDISPAYTIRASAANQCRAIIIERTGYGDRDPIIRNTDEPCQTIRSSVGCDERGGFRSPITVLLEQADVRALDYRCLARLQSIPDWYEFGDRAGKNCEAIGNAVPPLFAQRVIESMVKQNA
jgi:DNA (cytosine-5)-methyltransferase 1